MDSSAEGPVRGSLSAWPATWCEPDCAQGAEDTAARCADGCDNDGDGYLDCDDFDCTRTPGVTVCPLENTEALCSDGISNDADSYVDCDDWDCGGCAVCGGPGC